MVKIGAELPKLSQKIKLGIRFLDHPVYHISILGAVPLTFHYSGCRRTG